MDDVLKIYIDRLRAGGTDRFSGSVAPDFLEVEDRGIAFRQPVEVSGEAYLVEKMLVVHVKAQTVALVRCIICDDLFDYPVKLQSVYITLPLDEVKSGVYDITLQLREEILLEIPHFLECHRGECPSRQEIKKYLITGEDSKEDTYHPFTEL